MIGQFGVFSGRISATASSAKTKENKTSELVLFSLVQGAGFEPANSNEERFTVSCV